MRPEGRVKKIYGIWGVRSYIDFCKNRLSQFESLAVLENVQKSKMDVLPEDLNPQMEGMLIANTNLKPDPSNFQLKRNLSELELQKRSFHCLQFEIFFY